jgi:hypothetical protein
MSIKTAYSDKLTHLYNYQRYELKWLENLLRNGEIKFSSPKDFNDPWDCNFLYDNSPSQENFTFLNGIAAHDKSINYVASPSKFEDWSIICGILNNLSQDLTKSVQEKYRVYCLTPLNTCHLMWAHYANNHKGVCIEFKVGIDCLGGAYRVSYSNKQPIGYIYKSDINQTVSFLTTKPKPWHYEQEYRVIAIEEDMINTKQSGLIVTRNDFANIPTTSISAIVLGYRTSQKQEDDLRQLLKKLNVDVALRKASKVYGKYEIDIKDI